MRDIHGHRDGSCGHKNGRWGVGWLQNTHKLESWLAVSVAPAVD